MNPTPTLWLRRPRWPAALLILLGTAGCGIGAKPSDPTDGRNAIVTVLDAWKAGEKPEALAQRSPSIHVADSDWKSGLTLQGYDANGEGKLVGSDLNYKVVLELKDARGKVVKKEATYAVTTHPQLLVMRQDD
ncbi:hypothetical protein [Aquisphaera insulae]|uniref:hypothetical protein n=1 Tax=Aquisphaera insulae TaxID=2712864 RepID=UPI0013EB7CD9|nr:hypothetical protein [Aquisphaera insulae]